MFPIETAFYDILSTAPAIGLVEMNTEKSSYPTMSTECFSVFTSSPAYLITVPFCTSATVVVPKSSLLLSTKHIGWFFTRLKSIVKPVSGVAVTSAPNSIS
jgi:hypothetical protein